jgi:hypothetical protein
MRLLFDLSKDLDVYLDKIPRPIMTHPQLVITSPAPSGDSMWAKLANLHETSSLIGHCAELIGFTFVFWRLSHRKVR